MSAKKGFDPKQFLVEHGEKVALGVVVLLAGYIFYASLQLKPYEKQPDALSQRANQLTTQVNNQNWEGFLEYSKQQQQQVDAQTQLSATTGGDASVSPDARSLEVEPFPQMVAEMKVPIDRKIATNIEPLAPPFVRPNKVRRQPELETIVALQASTGIGAFEILKDPDALPGDEAGNADDEEEVIIGRNRPTEPRPQPRGTQRPDQGRERLTRSERLKQQLAESRRRRQQMRQANEGSGEGAMPAEDPYAMGEEGFVGGEYGPGFDDPYSSGFAGSLGSSGNSESQGRRWIVLTGVFNLGKQQREFIDTLGVTQETFNPQTDQVQVVSFEIRRAEVRSSGEKPAEEDFKLLSHENVIEEINQWALIPPAMIPPEYTLANACSPLPPRLDKNWSPQEVVHPEFAKNILKNEEADRLLDEQIKAAESEETAESGKVTSPFASAGNNTSRGPYGYGGGGYEGAMPGGPEGPGYGEGAYQGEGAYGPQGSRAYGPQEAVTQQMFRYFDTSVKSGKTYVYQVRLQLKNPNFGVAPARLEDPSLAKKEYLYTPWSEISPPKTVQDTSGMLAGPVDDGSASRESTAKIILSQWDNEVGKNALAELELARGQVINAEDKTVHIVPPGQRRGAIEKKVDFFTNTMLVDFIGGVKLRYRSQLTEPAEMVFVDEQGNLIVRSEAQDLGEYNSAKDEMRNAVAPPSRSPEPTIPGISIPGVPDPYDPLSGGS